MHDLILNILLGLLCLLVVQVNVFVAWHLYHARVLRKIQDRFTRVDSLADLHALDNPEMYRPQAPPEVPDMWDFMQGDGR